MRYASLPVVETVHERSVQKSRSTKRKNRSRMASSYGYSTFYSTQNYHITKDRTEKALQVQPNDYDIYSKAYNVGNKSIAFEKQSFRKPFAYNDQLSDQRFENINYSPDCYTKTSKIVGLSFEKQVSRNSKKMLVPLTITQADYDSA